tara:strand:- start:300 stop:488 length:189 start_codon:yes stop_codon:yes gene_type:complete
MSNLESYMRIAQDTKKEFVYSKCEGCWSLHDRDSEDELHGSFAKFYSALYDAVEPYLEDKDE